MTCIVAVAEGGKVFMGGDSMGTAGWNSRVLATPKVFRKGPFLFGVCGSMRMGQLLQYKLAIPDQDGIPDMTYIMGPVLDAVRECLRVGGFAKVSNNQETGGFCFIGYKGKIYQFDDDYGVIVVAGDFAAMGSGDMSALGAMMAMVGTPPRERIERALEISAYFSAGVCGPFHILSSEGRGAGGEGPGADLVEVDD